MHLSLPTTSRLPLPLALKLKVTLAVAHDPNLKVALTLVLIKVALSLNVRFTPPTTAVLSLKVNLPSSWPHQTTGTVSQHLMKNSARAEQ